MEDLPWYCVQVRRNEERLADHSLRTAGFPTYLPMFSSRIGGADARIKPLFPGYMFAQPRGDGQWIGMMYLPGVAGLLRPGQGAPYPAPPANIARLLRQCAPNGVIYDDEPPAAVDGIAVGDELLVPGMGIRGLCTKTDAARVWVLLEWMARPVEVRLRRDQVERVNGGHGKEASGRTGAR